MPNGKTVQTTLAADAAPFIAGVNRAAASMEQFARAAEQSGNRSSSAFQRVAEVATGVFVGTLATQVVGRVTSALSTIPDIVINLNASLEQARISFTTMLGSAQQADTFLRQLADFAAETPFEFPELVDASKRLFAFGFTAQEVVPMLTAVGDAAAALGGSGALIQRITLALGQMQAKAKVSGEEIRQLAEAGIPAWKMLADAMGKPIPVVMKLSEQGKISSRVFIDAFQEFSKQNYGDMMKKQSTTFVGAMSTIKDNLRMAIADGTKPLFDSISALVLRVAEFTKTEQFKAWADTLKSVGRAATYTLSSLAGSIGALIAQALALTGAITGWKTLADPLELVRAVADKAFHALLKLADVVLELADKVRERLEPILRKVAEMLPSLAKQAEGLTMAVLGTDAGVGLLATTLAVSFATKAALAAIGAAQRLAAAFLALGAAGVAAAVGIWAILGPAGIATIVPTLTAGIIAAHSAWTRNVAGIREAVEGLGASMRGVADDASELAMGADMAGDAGERVSRKLGAASTAFREWQKGLALARIEYADLEAYLAPEVMEKAFAKAQQAGTKLGDTMGAAVKESLADKVREAVAAAVSVMLPDFFSAIRAMTAQERILLSLEVERAGIEAQIEEMLVGTNDALQLQADIAKGILEAKKRALSVLEAEEKIQERIAALPIQQRIEELRANYESLVAATMPAFVAQMQQATVAGREATAQALQQQGIALELQTILAGTDQVRLAELGHQKELIQLQQRVVQLTQQEQEARQRLADTALRREIEGLRFVQGQLEDIGNSIRATLREIQITRELPLQAQLREIKGALLDIDNAMRPWQWALQEVEARTRQVQFALYEWERAARPLETALRGIEARTAAVQTRVRQVTQGYQDQLDLIQRQIQANLPGRDYTQDRRALELRRQEIATQLELNYARASLMDDRAAILEGDLASIRAQQEDLRLRQEARQVEGQILNLPLEEQAEKLRKKMEEQLAPLQEQLKLLDLQKIAISDQLDAHRVSRTLLDNQLQILADQKQGILFQLAPLEQRRQALVNASGVIQTQLERLELLTGPLKDQQTILEAQRDRYGDQVRILEGQLTPALTARQIAEAAVTTEANSLLAVLQKQTAELLEQNRLRTEALTAPVPVPALGVGEEEYQYGGRVRRTGLAWVHAGEVVLNPAAPRPELLIAAGVRGGNIFVNVHDNAFRDREDIDYLVAEVKRELGTELRGKGFWGR